MMGPIVRLDGSRITDRETLHEELARAFGLPDFYGRNLDGWIDCMSSLDEDDGMSSITIRPGQVLTLQIDGYRDLKRRCPELVDAVVECSAFVNWRRIERGFAPVLALSFHGWSGRTHENVARRA